MRVLVVTVVHRPDDARIFVREISALIAAGHHATERYGVQALGEHLAQEFGIATQFIDLDNPV